VIFANFARALCRKRMARRARVECPGACYHVITRGNQRQRIFRDLDTEIPHALALLIPYPPENMGGYDLSTLVNNSRNDLSECIQPIEGLNRDDGTIQRILDFRQRGPWTA
jgi:hypothetical protein